MSPLRLVIHGGCGTGLTLENTLNVVQDSAKESLRDSLLSGLEILNQGGTAVDAVVEAIRVMEDFPLFNAGKGAVFTSEGRNECDAGVMDGRNNMAGGVSSLRT